MLIEPFVLFSLGAALSFTCADFFARKGLQYANHFVGATITLVGELALLIPLVLLLGSPFPEPGAHYIWVMIGGTCNPGLFPHLFPDRHSPDRCGARGADQGDVPDIRRSFGAHFFGERSRPGII